MNLSHLFLQACCTEFSEKDDTKSKKLKGFIDFTMILYFLFKDNVLPPLEGKYKSHKTNTHIHSI